MIRRSQLCVVLLLISPISHAGDGPGPNIRTVEIQHSQIWSAGRVDLIPGIYRTDFIGHFPGGTVGGRDGIRRRVESHRKSFPDWNETIVDVISEGDKIVTRFVSRGTNLGPFLGHPPTGNTVEISEVSIFRMVDGMIAEQWVYPDTSAMQRQLFEE